jgi:hypothetical protein
MGLPGSGYHLRSGTVTALYISSKKDTSNQRQIQPEKVAKRQASSTVYAFGKAHLLLRQTLKSLAILPLLLRIIL